MSIWFSNYQLYPIGTLNSKSKAQFRQGTLLRIRNEDGSVGYSDLCPFSVMGDSPLESHLKGLKIGKLSTLTKRSLHFANIDAQARMRGVCLYDTKIKIKNHFLISDISRFAVSRVSKIESSGYSEFKIKMGRDITIETENLFNLVKGLSATAKVRIDFNCSLSRDRFIAWFDSNQKWLRPVLEFIEDPFNYDANEWRTVSQKWGITLALDQAEDAIKTGAEGAQVIVIKPAIQDEYAIINKFKDTNKKFVFTHYMDFPVGQMFAYVCAQKAQAYVSSQLLTCGLQHHDVYEGFSFQDAIKYDGPYVLPPEGFGIGFDALLAASKWIEM